MFNWRLLIYFSALTALFSGLIYWHNESIRQHPILPVAFEHLDHESIQCTNCHHNFVDDTGHDSCYSCHKRDASVALEIERMFHDFCRDCHIKEAQNGLVSGPFRVCGECHHNGGRLASNNGLKKR